MSKGDRITRNSYNALQTQVAGLMGVGSGTTGYGQALVSRQANIGEVITATLLSVLRTDMAKAYAHQRNVAVVDSAVVGPPNLKLYVSGDVVSDFITQYTDFINNGSTGILANKDLANAAQLQANISISNTQRSTVWGGSAQVQAVSHTVTVTFGGYTQGSLTVSAADHARVFFNGGGSIQVSASRSGGTASSKNTIWSNMLSGIGNLSLRAISSTLSGSLNPSGSVATSVGFFNLTVGAGATTLLTQTGPTGVYAENDYIVQVRRPSTNTIEFIITFRDDDAGDQTGLGAPVDEPVDGTLTSLIQCTRPFGSNVDVPAPTASSTAIV